MGGDRRHGEPVARRAASGPPRPGDAHTPFGHHGRARRGQVDAHRRARRLHPRATGSRSACSPSIRPARSAAVRSSATASACSTTRPTPACSSVRWRRAAISVASRWRRRRRCGCSTPSGKAVGHRSRRSVSARSRSRSRRHADTTVVVVNPGLGRRGAGGEGGAARDRRHLRREQGRPARRGRDVQRPRACSSCRARAGWRPPIVRTVATDGKGVDELWAQVQEHRAYLESSGDLVEAPAPRLREELRALVVEQLLEADVDARRTGAVFDDLVDDVAARATRSLRRGRRAPRGSGGLVPVMTDLARRPSARGAVDVVAEPRPMTSARSCCSASLEHCSSPAMPSTSGRSRREVHGRAGPFLGRDRECMRRDPRARARRCGSCSPSRPTAAVDRVAGYAPRFAVMPLPSSRRAERHGVKRMLASFERLYGGEPVVPVVLVLQVVEVEALAAPSCRACDDEHDDPSARRVRRAGAPAGGW